MSEHTLGPWYIFGSLNIRGKDGRGVATTGGIADSRAEDGGLGESCANARLIAAAPDMLAALRIARQWMPVQPILDEARAECAVVDAAIAKATAP